MIIVKDKILHEYNKDCEGDGVQDSELKDGSRVTKCKTVLLHSPAATLALCGLCPARDAHVHKTSAG